MYIKEFNVIYTEKKTDEYRLYICKKSLENQLYRIFELADRNKIAEYIKYFNSLNFKDFYGDFSIDEKYYIDNEKTQKLIRTLIDNGTLQNTMLRTEQNRTEQNRTEQNRSVLTERLKNRKNEKLQTASRQDMTAESATSVQMETWLLTDCGEKAEKRIDVARALKARDYKGLDNYGSNGVIEWKY